MGIEATSTSSMSVSSTTASSNTSSASAKTNTDASFKDEMSKVSKSEEKKDTKEVSKSETSKSQDSKDKEKASLTSEKSENKKSSSGSDVQDNKNVENAQLAFNQYSMNDANMMLSNDIAQMVENSASLSSVNNKSWTIGFGDESKNSIKMNESDAQFFLNLTQNKDVSMQGIMQQGQGMLNSGAEASEVAQNVKVSQTLLNALNESRQNNQPIRIDFDQNVSVILRVGRDGAISAQFIPSDKVAEQYLRANIDELRASFDEQDLPYSELSYSNSSKEQNKRRREQNRQGE